jgi:hypothetical protein
MILQDPNLHIDMDKTTIITLQDLSYLQKKLIIFGDNEISLAYRREDLSELVHTDLGNLVTGYFAVVLIADSSVKLRKVVAGTFNNHGKYSPQARGSLNSSLSSSSWPTSMVYTQLQSGGRYRLIKEYQSLGGFMKILFAKFPVADTVEYVVLDFMIKEQIQLMSRIGKQFNPFESVEVQETPACSIFETKS